MLWSLSNVSGALFQKPLFTALNIEGQALAVCSPSSIAKFAFEHEKKLLMAPPILRGASSIPRFMWNAAASKRQLSGLLREKAELVHVTMQSPVDAYYLAAAKRAGVPTVLTIHDNARHLGEGSRILDAVEKLTLANADHIVTVSDFVFDEVKRKFKNKSVHVVRGGLLTRDEPGLKPRKAMHNPPRVLFLGRIHEYKGLALLLQSLELLDRQGHIVKLTIAGSGNLAPYSEALLRRADVQIINEWIDDATVLKLLGEHDILALPYLEASQSGVAIDAQWGAMPAVATPAGALPQQFRHGVDALICKEVSAAAFADSLKMLMNDDRLYENLSQGAHQAYREKDLIAVARMWRDFYKLIA